MATTYTRIKNRRGLRADLPQPLADGEIGLALDTRELYIGVGNQDLLNTDVQVKPFTNAQSVISNDLGINTSTAGLLFFKVTGTDVFDITPSTTFPLQLTGTNGLPQHHPAGTTTEQELVVTKYLNGMPTTLDSTQYSLTFASSVAYLNFTGSNVPEAGSQVVVCKWTKERITEAIRARASWSTNSSVASYNKYQESDLVNNQTYVDVTTATGFVEFVSSTEKTALTTDTTDCLNTAAGGKIDEPTQTNSSSTYGTFLGENTIIHTPVRNVDIDANLKIDLDSPQQAYLIARYINKKRGTSVARVANNVEIFTEASYPQYQTNQYIGAMRTAELTASGSGTVIEYPVAESNVFKIDYSLKLGSNFRTGTVYVTTDGSNTVINDTNVETNSTADVTFSAAISSAKLQFKYANANSSIANLSYKIERWLQA